MTASTKVSPSSADAQRRMQNVRQKVTSAEFALRLNLHALGFRYRIQVPVLLKPHSVTDMAFIGLRVADLVDGCFLHGCPQQATWPKQNVQCWRAKVATIVAKRREKGHA